MDDHQDQQLQVLTVAGRSSSRSTWRSPIYSATGSTPEHPGDHAYRLVRASQDLAAAAQRLWLAAEEMSERRELEVFGDVLRRALLALDGERRTERVLVTPPED